MTGVAPITGVEDNEEPVSESLLPDRVMKHPESVLERVLWRGMMV